MRFVVRLIAAVVFALVALGFIQVATQNVGGFGMGSAKAEGTCPKGMKWCFIRGDGIAKCRPIRRCM